MSNPFSPSFGNRPFVYVSREAEERGLIAKMPGEPPMAHCFLIAGVRGAGKTVMLNSVSKQLKEDENWAVVALNPEDDMREALAAKLYTSSLIKHLFLEKDFSFSFQGLTFSLSEKNPVLNIDDLLERMMKAISSKGKKVLICIDEVSNNRYMKQLAFAFQLFGYLLFERKKKTVDEEILSSFDKYLDEYAYSKIWSSLSKVEKNIVAAFTSDSAIQVASILRKTGMSKEHFSRYRDRLIKKGVVTSKERGGALFRPASFQGIRRQSARIP